MATLQSTLRLNDQMSSVLRNITNALNVTIVSFESMQQHTSNPINTRSLQTARVQLAAAGAQFDRIEHEIIQANQQQQRLNGSIRDGQQAAGGLLSSIKGYIGAFVGIYAIGKAMSEVDDYANQKARLDNINDGHQKTADLQKQIYASAQRSKGSFGDTVNTVAKLGLLAKDAFSGNKETVRFAELMNKSFKVSGAGMQERTAGMYQLTQAMASGKLQGDEFRSIRENAPMLANSIETHMKKTLKMKGTMKDWSAEGKITASIIKNALFRASDDIEKKFMNMPMTFGDAWMMIKNTAVIQFGSAMDRVNGYLNGVNGKAMVQGLSDGIGDLANVLGVMLTTVMTITSFFVRNWSMISPILYGIIAALVIYNGKLALASFWAGILAIKSAIVAAAWMTPVLVVIALVAAFYLVIAVINRVTGKSISATGLIVGALFAAGAFIGNLFVTTINLILDVIGLLFNAFAKIANFIGNVFNNPVRAVVQLFSGMLGAVLEVIQGVASAIDTITGTNLAGAVKNVRVNLQGATDNLVGKNKVFVPEIDPSIGHIKRFEYGKSFSAGQKVGADLQSRLNPSGIFDALKDNVSSIAGNTGDMKDSMNSSKEDLKYLRDIASKSTINRFTTAKISVDMTNHNNINSGMDIDGVVSHLETKVREAMSVSAEGVHNV